MSQILADEHLGYSEVIAPLQSWTTVQRIEELAPDSILKDDRVLQILRAQKQPTFITLDGGFYRKRYRDRRYCVIYFALSHLEQNRLPGLLRRLFRLPLFKTKTARMGKIVRVSEEKVVYWQVGDEKRYQVIWRVR